MNEQQGSVESFSLLHCLGLVATLGAVFVSGCATNFAPACEIRSFTSSGARVDGGHDNWFVVDEGGRAKFIRYRCAPAPPGIEREAAAGGVTVLRAKTPMGDVIGQDGAGDAGRLAVEVGPQLRVIDQGRAVTSLSRTIDGLVAAAIVDERFAGAVALVDLRSAAATPRFFSFDAAPFAVAFDRSEAPRSLFVVTSRAVDRIDLQSGKASTLYTFESAQGRPTSVALIGGRIYVGLLGTVLSLAPDGSDPMWIHEIDVHEQRPAMRGCA